MSVLKIDLDGKVTPCKWLKWCAHAGKVVPLMELTVKGAEVSRSPSGGAHVRLKVEQELSDLEVVAAQAILRSDHAREALNFSRVRFGQPGNVLHTHDANGERGEPWPQGLLGLRNAGVIP